VYPFQPITDHPAPTYANITVSPAASRVIDVPHFIVAGVTVHTPVADLQTITMICPSTPLARVKTSPPASASM
jgi:hypothetical protein